MIRKREIRNLVFFDLPEDKALINRLGFNNEGTQKVVERLKKIQPNCVLGVNIGKNKDVPNEKAIENYLKSFDLAFEVADYIAVNVSSPNTPNLRELQKASELGTVCWRFAESKYKIVGRKKNKTFVVKIAPDLAENEIEEIVDICLRIKFVGNNCDEYDY